MKNYQKSEKRLLELFTPGTLFTFEGREYLSQIVDKPVITKGGGEGKTDVYVLAFDISDGSTREIKISYKQENADSIENWLSPISAERIFGSHWEDELKDILESIRSELENYPKYKRAKQKDKIGGTYNIGFGADIRTAPRQLSFELKNLNKKVKHDIYSGQNMPEHKRNLRVENEIIENSGVANYILILDDLNDVQKVADNLISIDDWVEKGDHKLYLCLKSINYRYTESRGETSRSILVPVQWRKEERLKGYIDLNNILRYKSTELIENFQNLLKNN